MMGAESHHIKAFIERQLAFKSDQADGNSWKELDPKGPGDVIEGFFPPAEDVSLEWKEC